MTDTLKIARELHPGKRNSLDALCERYQVSNAHRTLHGALLDAGLLGEVYLAMTRGQDSLLIELDAPVRARLRMLARRGRGRAGCRIVLTASADELAEHERMLAAIDKESKGRCLWLKLDAEPAGELSPAYMAAPANRVTARQALLAGFRPLLSAGCSIGQPEGGGRFSRAYRSQLGNGRAQNRPFTRHRLGRLPSGQIAV